MREFPEDHSIQFPIHDRGIVRELVEVGPARQFAVQALHHVNLVHAIIAGQFFNQLVRKVSELVPGYRRDWTHCTPGPSFANDAVTQKGEPIVDKSNMGFIHIKQQLQGAFQKRSAFLTNGLSMWLVSRNDDANVISISTVSHRRHPLPLFTKGNGSLALDAVVPVPAILPGLVAQVFRLQPLIKLIEHDVRQER